MSIFTKQQMTKSKRTVLAWHYEICEFDKKTWKRREDLYKRDLIRATLNQHGLNRICKTYEMISASMFTRLWIPYELASLSTNRAFIYPDLLVRTSISLLAGISYRRFDPSDSTKTWFSISVSNNPSAVFPRLRYKRWIINAANKQPEIL